MRGTKKRNIEICFGCKNFWLRENKRVIGSYLSENLPVDKPSYGNSRYFKCFLDNEHPIHLEASLIQNDFKARRKYERRDVSRNCPMLVEQQIQEWSSVKNEATT